MRSLRTFLTLLCVVIAVVASAIEPSNIVVNLNGKEYYKHRVESGQTLYALAKAYGVTEQQIIDSNVGLTASSLRADDYILIPRTKSKTYGSERKVSLDADRQEGEISRCSHNSPAKKSQRSVKSVPISLNIVIPPFSQSPAPDSSQCTIHSAGSVPAGSCTEFLLQYTAADSSARTARIRYIHL